MKKKIDAALIRLKCRAQRFSDNMGSSNVVMLIKILIAVVVGALVLGLIVALICMLCPELAQYIVGEKSIFRSPSAALF